MTDPTPNDALMPTPLSPAALEGVGTRSIGTYGPIPNYRRQGYYFPRIRATR